MFWLLSFLKYGFFEHLYSKGSCLIPRMRNIRARVIFTFVDSFQDSFSSLSFTAANAFGTGTRACNYFSFSLAFL